MLTLYNLRRIDGKHNKAVIASIIKEIGDSKFTKKQMEGLFTTFCVIMYVYYTVYTAAVKSHMKYLRDTRHVRPPAVQHRVRIRSRQQRVKLCE